MRASSSRLLCVAILALSSFAHAGDAAPAEAPTGQPAAVPEKQGPVEPPPPSKKCSEGEPCLDELRVGRGFHPFDKGYFLLGLNWAQGCQSSVLDLEGSIVAPPTSNLFWGGVFFSGGFRNSLSTTGSCDEVDGESFARLAHGRYGAGVEGGWRILAMDAAYMYDAAIADFGTTSARPFSGHGLRFRGGIALANELFTGERARFRRSCCSPGSKSQTACECDRTPVGVSLFLYAGCEVVPKFGDATEMWFEPTFGLTFKVGAGAGTSP